VLIVWDQSSADPPDFRPDDQHRALIVRNQPAGESVPPRVSLA